MQTFFVQILPNDETCVDLVVGQLGPSALIVGEVCIEGRDDDVRVTFQAADGWRLAETQYLVTGGVRRF